MFNDDQGPDYSAMYGVEIYDRFIGNQSPADFMNEFNGNVTITDAVNEYADSEHFKNLDEETKDHVINELIKYIKLRVIEPYEKII